MADDYLGKKMADYESGRLARKSVAAHRSSTAPREGYIKNPFEPMRVVVTDGLSDMGRRVVTTLRGVGMRVAFLGDDLREGNRLAQATGSRFYPGMELRRVLGEVEAIWGAVDMIVNPEDCAGHGPLLVSLKDYEDE